MEIKITEVRSPMKDTVIKITDVHSPMHEGDKLSNAITSHFIYIKKQFHQEISLLIKEISQFSSTDYNKIESISTLKFKIGEIEYYSKKGNLYITIPKTQMDGIKLIVEKHFGYVPSEIDEDTIEVSL